MNRMRVAALLFALCVPLTGQGATPPVPAPDGGDPPGAMRPDSNGAGYHMLDQQAARDAPGQYELALWCEAHGLTRERLKHLTLAVLRDPDHPGAHGLLGQVAYRGRWRHAEDLASLLARDGLLAEALAAYRARRDRMEDTPDAHWRLALWCEENGLEPEAIAHLTAVTRRDPGRDAAWRRLGYQRRHGRWMTPEQIDAEAAAREARERADRRWKPRLAALNAALRDESRRGRAELELSRVTDPGAVPAIWRTFVEGQSNGQSRAIRLLAQIEGPTASRALAILAILAEAADTRRLATEILARRDPRDVVGPLLGLLLDPIRYVARPVQGPGDPGILVVAGDEYNLRRFYTVPPLPADTMRRLIDPTTPPDFTLPIALVLGEDWARYSALPVMNQVTRNNVKDLTRNLAIAARATFVAQRQLVNDVDSLEIANDRIDSSNARVLSVLVAITGRDQGKDREASRAWWVDHQGYAYHPLESGGEFRPTYDDEVPLPYVPRYQRITGMSCFGAGTPVWTREGRRPIESVRVGDVVLTRDTRTGGLRLAPVLAIFHNPPAATWRIRLDAGEAAETIVATGIHRFWSAGRGWVMARNLERGDAIRTLASRGVVSSSRPGAVEPVFNLEVGEDRSFLVGEAGALVHDNSLVGDTPAPFDRMADPEAAVDRR